MTYYWIILGLVYLALIIQDISESLTTHVDKIEPDSEEKQIVKGHSNVSVQDETKLPKEDNTEIPLKEK